MSDAHPASRSARARSRYGSSSSSARTGKSWTNRALVLIFLGMLVAAVVFGVQYVRSQQKINADISYVTHEILSDDTARVWVDITRNRVEEPAYCIVQAFDYSKAEVGRREIAVPAGGEAAHASPWTSLPITLPSPVASTAAPEISPPTSISAPWILRVRQTPSKSPAMLVC